MTLRTMFDRWKRGFLIFFWIYLAWGLGGLVLFVPFILLLFGGARLGLDHGFLVLLPLLVAPFVVTSETFRSILSDLVDQSTPDETNQ